MGHDNDSDEVFTSVRSQPMTSGNYNDSYLPDYATLKKRLELAEAVADMLVEDCAIGEGFTTDADALEVALVAWEKARGARFVYTDDIEYIIASGRGGLAVWLVEQGYDAAQSDWELVPPETPITIVCDKDGVPCAVEDNERVEVPTTCTAAEWLERVHQNGLLCREG